MPETGTCLLTEGKELESRRFGSYETENVISKVLEEVG